MEHRFNPPPNWPSPPEGWQPPAGWMPDPAWGPAPADWQYWVPAVAEPAKPATVDVPRFGARSKAKELGAEVERLRADMERLGVLSVAELERDRDQLQQRIEELQQEVADRTGDVQRREQELAERLAKQERKHAERLAKQEQEARERTEKSTRHAEHEAQSLVARLEAMRQQVVVTEEIALLQEVGIYQYRHPLTDAVAYQAELARLQDQIKTMTKRDGGAVLATSSWTVNGSAAQGRSQWRVFKRSLVV